MSFGRDAKGRATISSLCRMFVEEYATSPADERVPAVLNAIGACAGFASQIAVWRELILPKGRDPGDFLVYCGTGRSNEIFLLGEAINQFLFSTGPDRLSFLSVAAGGLPATQLPNIAELAGRVVRTFGSDGFGTPRLPANVKLSELPRDALARTWGNATEILKDCRAGDWPALLGAAAQALRGGSHQLKALPIPTSAAVTILLEAAVPMSKLNPASVAASGIDAPTYSNWGQRALRPGNDDAIEARAAMPRVPEKRDAVLTERKIAFVNMAGAISAAIAADDYATIGEIFGPNARAADGPVPCDVLFLYCNFEPSGKIAGCDRSLSDLIRDCGATVVVIAWAEPADYFVNAGFRAALQQVGNPPVNLTVTMNRNGEYFGRFFV
ncbi:MAG: hypothetical protein E7774_14180, partial [Bradyrhizobium sp.]